MCFDDQPAAPLRRAGLTHRRVHVSKPSALLSRRRDRPRTLSRAAVHQTRITGVPYDAAVDHFKAVFLEIVASVKGDHFQPIDRPLLEQYAVAVSIAREVAQAIDDDGVVVDGRVHPAAKFLKTQQALCGQLASRLRLCTQNRMSKERATTGAYGGAESIAELYERAK